MVGIVFAIITCSSILFAAFLTNKQNNYIIKPSSSYYKLIVDIKKNCSPKVSSLIREKASDGTLTWRECEEITKLHRQECDQKDMAELLK